MGCIQSLQLAAAASKALNDKATVALAKIDIDTDGERMFHPCQSKSVLTKNKRFHQRNVTAVLKVT